MGYGVSDGEEFPAIIRDALRAPEGGGAVPVLNAGIGDSGNGRWVKFLRADAAAYEPSLVVMQVHQNDFDNNVGEREFELTEAGDLRELPVPPPSRARRLQTVIERIPGLEHLHLLGLFRQLRHTRGFATPAEAELEPDAAMADYGARLTVRLIAESLRICARHGWPVVGLLVDLDPQQADTLERLFAAFGADVVVFPGRQERPELYYIIDGHWRPEGHQLAARALIERLHPYIGRQTTAQVARQPVAALGE
jgi:hypothetical protein